MRKDLSECKNYVRKIIPYSEQNFQTEFRQISAIEHIYLWKLPADATITEVGFSDSFKPGYGSFFMTLTETDPSDAELIERVRASDLSALGGLFDRYYAQVYRAALAITQDNAVADDIAQDCFLKVHRYANRIDTSLPLAPWLYRVTVNLSYTWISRQKKRRVSLETVVDRLISPIWSSPDHIAEHSEVQSQVREAIRELNFNQRVVVVLHYMSGLSLEEIADVTNCPVGTVKSRLYYARENLRRRLDTVNWPHEVAHGFAR
jgi:RNA polymerase sigma-70 factor (ECF subfamily)